MFVRLLGGLVAALFAVAGSFLAADAGGTFAARSASTSQLDVDLFSALGADYSADPDMPKFAPLDPEIIQVAASDELALSIPDDPAGSSDAQAVPRPAPRPTVVPPVPSIPADVGPPAEPGGGPDAEPGVGPPAEPGDGPDAEPGVGPDAEPGDGPPAEPGGGPPAEPGGGPDGRKP